MDRRVRDLMHRDFIHVSPDQDVSEVLGLMAMAHVRALPVVAEGRSGGIVAHRDLARAALRQAGEGGGGSGPVAPFVRPIEPVSDEAQLPEAARRMLGSGMPCLLAVAAGDGDQRVVGLVTESDLLREAYRVARPRRP